MDINLLSKMIKELILDKDRVVLPGLGCFVAEIVPSTFSDKGFTINPPYRKISFRSKPDKGGELVEFYARLNGIDVPMATRIIEDFIKELRSNLYVKKVVVFPDLGRLRATKENNVFFIPDEDLDIFPAGLGLEPISLKTHKETQEELSEAVVGLKSIIEQPVEDVHVINVVRTAEEVTEEMSEEVTEEVSEEMSGLDGKPVSDTEEQRVDAEVQVVEDQQDAEVVESEDVQQEVVDEHCVENVETAEVAAIQEVVDAKKAALEEEKAPVVKKSGAKWWLIAVAAVILLIAYVAVARMVPGVFDTILYTPEELEILNYKI